MAISVVLQALRCRDQTPQHAEPNHRYKLGENAFRGLKAGCGCGSCLVPISSWASPEGALPAFCRQWCWGWKEWSIPLCHAGVSLPIPQGGALTSVLAQQTCRFYSLVSMSFNKLSESPPLHMVRLQFLNACSMGKSNPISCNTKPCTAPQWGLFSCQIASFKPQPIQP